MNHVESAEELSQVQASLMLVVRRNMLQNQHTPAVSVLVMGNSGCIDGESG